MGRWYTTEERTEREERLQAAREHWQGVTLDYGPYQRRVVDVGIDDRDRLVLYARNRAIGDGNGRVPELASDWED
jgi:hypothetical protein